MNGVLEEVRVVRRMGVMTRPAVDDVGINPYMRLAERLFFQVVALAADL